MVLIRGTVASWLMRWTFGSSGPGLNPGQEHLVVFSYSHSAILTQLYEWVPANLLPRVRLTLRWNSILLRGEVEILLVALS